MPNSNYSLEIEQYLDASYILPRSIPESCPSALKLLNKEVSFQPRLSFMHVTKAGGTTVEWVLHRESIARNYSRFLERKNLYAKEVPLMKLPKGVHYFTMLREPGSRFASYVYFRRFDIKSKYQRHGRDLVWSAKAFSNLYTRMLTNVQTGIQYNYKASQGCISAKKILREKFAVVGTSERMLESLAIVGYVFHFKTFPVFGRINQQIGAPSFSAFTPLVRSYVINANKCDIILHKAANMILDQIIQCLGSDFSKYLDAFTKVQSDFEKNTPGCIGKCINYGDTHRSGKFINFSVGIRNV